MRGTAPVAVILAAALTAASPLPALAQDAAAQAARHAIVDGHDIQPRPPAAEGQPGDAEAARLLRAHPEAGPIVQPRDLYGRPLGGSPGLDPPDPRAKPPAGMEH